MNSFQKELKLRKNELKKFNVLIGFDAFIDRIIKPVKCYENNKKVFFEKIEEFANHILSKKGLSCSIEQDITKVKIGGNAPIFTNTLLEYGINCCCIGMFGKKNEIFNELRKKAKLISYANTIYSDCYEFLDGKIMLAENTNKIENPFDIIQKEIVNIKKFDLLAFLNWSELSFAKELWLDMYNYYKGQLKDKNKYMFFDLSDCSRKSKEEIQSVLELISKYSNLRTTIISLNENEANIIGKILNEKDLELVARKIFKTYNIDQVIIHTLYTSYLLEGCIWYELDTYYCKKPLITTGAGDNFNAGYSIAQLLKLKPMQKLCAANTISGYYVKNGKKGSLENIMKFTI